MGADNSGSVGSVNNQRRLQTGVSAKTSFSGNKKDSSQYKKFGYFKFRNKFSFGKRGYRKSTSQRTNDRFLQYIIPSSKKEWTNETGYKFETTKSVSSEATLQNGHNFKGVKLSKTRRLGNKSGLKRRLFSYKSIQKSQEIPQIFCSRSSLPVQSPLFWPNIITTSFYEGGVSSCCPFKKTKHTSSSISRRLDVCQSVSTKTCNRSRNNVESPCSTRLFNQSRKVQFNTKSNNHLFGSGVQVRSRFGITNSGQDTESIFISTKSNEWHGNSQTLHGSIGENGILSRVDSECQVIYEACPITFTSKLDPIKNEFRFSNSMYSKPKSSFEMVVVFSKHYAGKIFKTKSDLSYDHCGCLQVRFGGGGGSHEQSNSSGSLDRGAKTVTYKQSRIGSSFSDCEEISEIFEKQTSFDSVRQCYGSPIHKQARRDSVTSAMSKDLGFMDVCPRKQNLSESSTHCGIG
ncbi:Hypothetical predicted protein [Mytilus galloprovincialis]|uniref:Uncharacterized protein n=1 Tax=Mytilus galloprovincialis TaxID=29158 RepID=A0A8B6HBQ8_MYTGA|nr:Hypothetical predicted protein [Mytilus galloprovincialis]